MLRCESCGEATDWVEATPLRACCGALACRTDSFETRIARTGGFPVVCAHRGGCGAGYAPENTMEAYRLSVHYGARLLEIDLHLSSDGHLVLMHWDTLGETTDGTGRIADHTLAQLRALDAGHYLEEFRGRGYRVPTFAEFLEEFAPHDELLFCLDFKEAEAARAAMRALEPYCLAHRVMLSAVFGEANGELQRLRPAPSTPVATTIAETLRMLAYYETGLLAHYTPQHDIYGFVLCKPTLLLWSARLIAAIHALGRRVAVFPWGDALNDPQRMRECLQWGVDYIFVDRPDLMQRVMQGETIK